MNQSEIERNILQSIIEVTLCEKEDFYESTKLADIEYLDSLDHIEIFMKIEQKCGITIADDKCEMLTKMPIRDIVDFVHSMVKEN